MRYHSSIPSLYNPKTIDAENFSFSLRLVCTVHKGIYKKIIKNKSCVYDFLLCFTRTYVNTLRPRQNCRHFQTTFFKWTFLNESVWISINISLRFVPRSPINNIPTLIHVLVWHRPGDKPLSEPMMVRLPTHTCVTRPQWGTCIEELAYFRCFINI